ncbi:hypothetical protein [Streptomyces abikoensis]|uniref:Translation elongation factor EFG/EF2 domain-containing protein n=1 Tax=Streptomyces abikoensis TaxID=97398 RepID=A0ABW7TCN2_9ACTN
MNTLCLLGRSVVAHGGDELVADVADRPADNGLDWAVGLGRCGHGHTSESEHAGACGPYAHIVADVEPPGPDGGLELLSLLPERRLPSEYLPWLKEGLWEGLGGVAAAVLVTDGSFHDVDSCELGYKIAGQQAGRAALIGAGLLPPEAAATLRWATWPGMPRLKPSAVAGVRRRVP